MKTKTSKAVSAASYAALQANYISLKRHHRRLREEFLLLGRQRREAVTLARGLEFQLKAAEAKAIFAETQAKEAAAARERSEAMSVELQAALDHTRAERDSAQASSRSHFKLYESACHELEDVKLHHREARDVVQAFTLMAKRLA